MIEVGELLSAEECDAAFGRVLALRDAWTPRDAWMSTLGAASYLDRQTDAYFDIAARSNPILLDSFPALYGRLVAHFERRLGKPVGYDPAIALPGFHVFVCRPEYRGIETSRHFDAPHLDRTWPGPIADPFSFTVPIRLPRAGGGLWWWEGGKLVRLPRHGREEQFLIGGQRRYQPYEPGRLYRIGPDCLHQIANDVELVEGDHRVSLQGHAVLLRDEGRYVLFF